jgi:hypothetical protein
MSAIVCLILRSKTNARGVGMSLSVGAIFGAECWQWGACAFSSRLSRTEAFGF